MKSQVGFGRRISKDERDADFLLPRRRTASAITQRFWWTPFPTFDQGATSQCVAYSGVRYLVSGPIRNKPLDFLSLYKECQKVDEWPGEDYEGTSVRSLFRVLKQRGLVNEYRWAFEFGPVIDHLLMVGPVVMGTYWTAGMANVRDDGYVSVGDIDQFSDGGHAWCLIGANRRKRNFDGTLGAARAVNSWGNNWGQEGRFWITFQDLDKLIKAEGEACVATEVKIAGMNTFTSLA